MSEHDFYRPEAKCRAIAAVQAVEAQTSAEVVIAVRRRSGDYRASAYHFGLGAMAIVVGVMLIVPWTFSVAAIVLDGFGAFLGAALLARNLDSLARLLVPRARRQANVDAAARVAFYDLGISRTTGRNGVLVFVSTFERVCAVVPDVGVDVAALGAPWVAVNHELGAAARHRDFEAFIAALERLGPVLGGAMPRAEDDVNELPDEVQ